MTEQCGAGDGNGNGDGGGYGMGGGGGYGDGRGAGYGPVTMTQPDWIDEFVLKEGGPTPEALQPFIQAQLDYWATATSATQKTSR